MRTASVVAAILVTSLACSHGTDDTPIDSARIDGADIDAPMIDAPMIDAMPTDARVDAMPDAVDAMPTPSEWIGLARMAADGSGLTLPIMDATITYVRPALGSDPAG